MQRITSRKLLVLALSTATALTAAASEPGSSTNSLAARIESARAEKRIDNRLHSLASIAKELRLAEIPDALKAADNLSSLRERLALKDSVLKRWGELAPADALAYVSQMPEGLSKTEAMRHLSTAYARTNGADAAAAVLKMKPGRARTEAISAVAEAWAGTDVRAALKWANELPDDGLRQPALRRIYFVWVHADPVAASTTVQTLPSGDIKNALLINVAQKWGVVDPAAAIRWARTLPVEAERDLAIVIATESWADSDPRAALKFAEELSCAELRRRAALVALERWATQDPEAAFNAAVRSSDRTVNEQGIIRVLQTCGAVCPDAAVHWVETLPSGRLRDNVIQACVEAVHVWQPEAAARLAAKITESSAREYNIEKALAVWLQLDGEAAKRWLADAAFSNETKARWIALKPESDF